MAIKFKFVEGFKVAALIIGISLSFGILLPLVISGVDWVFTGKFTGLTIAEDFLKRAVIFLFGSFILFGLILSYFLGIEWT